MKVFCILAVVVAAAYAFPGETYSTENDGLDLAVLQDVNTLKAFVECFTDKSPCNELTTAFKKDMPEAIEQACAKCTVPQKRIFRTFLSGLKEKLPAEYDEYKKKYDPNDKYFAPLVEAIAKD